MFGVARFMFVYWALLERARARFGSSARTPLTQQFLVAKKQKKKKHKQ